MKINVTYIPTRYVLDHGYSEYYGMHMKHHKQIDPFKLWDEAHTVLKPKARHAAPTRVTDGIWMPWLGEMHRFNHAPFVDTDDLVKRLKGER